MVIIGMSNKTFFQNLFKNTMEVEKQKHREKEVKGRKRCKIRTLTAVSMCAPCLNATIIYFILYIPLLFQLIIVALSVSNGHLLFLQKQKSLWISQYIFAHFQDFTKIKNCLTQFFKNFDHS